MPTLIIFGMLDPVTTEKDAAYLNECIAGSRLLGLQAAHLSNVEAAADFNRGLLSFLKGKTP